MPDELDEKMARIAEAITLGLRLYTDHGQRKRVARQVEHNEIWEAICSGRIIEDYPDHYLGPACLILGWTADHKPLHVLCSDQTIVDIITVYEPDLIHWEADLMTRRKP